YSLGVVFYELLCGLQPTPSSASLILPAPSTQITDRAAKTRATSASRLVLTLKGDLDAIAAKALSDDPSLRYASAASFAEDLQCYLAGHPVDARDRRLTYRIAKFIGRHRPSLVIAAVCSVTFTMLTLYAMLHQRAGGGTPTPLALPRRGRWRFYHL